jgi:hypothetical protein
VLYQLSYAGARCILGGSRCGSVAAAVDDPGVSGEASAKRRRGNEIEFSRIVACSDAG